jgi:predicted nucleotidyltransferase
MEQLELEIILALLKYGKLHVREIAKVIDSPHASVSRAMKRLLGKNIVDFKSEGKNKVFKLKKGIESSTFVYMAEYFKLLKLLQKYPSLPIIIESILSATDEKFIIIFGSFAKFNANKDSDIDIFIETRDRSVKKEIEGINSKLSIKIGKFEKNNLLIKEILKDHVIIRGIEHYYKKNEIFN